VYEKKRPLVQNRRKTDWFLCRNDTDFAKKSRFFVLLERWERLMAHEIGDATRRLCGSGRRNEDAGLKVVGGADVRLLACLRYASENKPKGAYIPIKSVGTYAPPP
jgi:hypothetical protein